jgi:hypothetical protein
MSQHLNLAIAIVTLFVFFLLRQRRLRKEAAEETARNAEIKRQRADEAILARKRKLRARAKSIGDGIFWSFQEAWQAAGSPAQLEPFRTQEESGRYVIVLGGFFPQEFRHGVCIDLRNAGREIHVQSMTEERYFGLADGRGYVKVKLIPTIFQS